MDEKDKQIELYKSLVEQYKELVKALKEELESANELIKILESK